MILVYGKSIEAVQGFEPNDFPGLQPRITPDSEEVRLGAVRGYWNTEAAWLGPGP